MDGLVVISILAFGGLLMAAAKSKGASGLNDTPVSLDNIRKGVARGWYSATLCRVNGQPAVYLYGRNTAGENTGDTHPISEDD